MVKRIIFDLDNTLIPWDNNWFLEIPKLFKKYNLEFKDKYLIDFNKAIDEYEFNSLRYSYSDLSKYIEDKMNIKLPDGFLKELTDIYGKLVPPIDNELISLLKYLSSKYSLVVATNWFKDQQISKLKEYGIYDMFDEVITGEDFDIKPATAMFDYFKEGYSNLEVVMVGDSYKTDIQGAINANVHAYFITNDLKYKSNKEYTVIKDIYELDKYL